MVHDNICFLTSTTSLFEYHNWTTRCCYLNLTPVNISNPASISGHRFKYIENVKHEPYKLYQLFPFTAFAENKINLRCSKLPTLGLDPTNASEDNRKILQIVNQLEEGLRVCNCYLEIMIFRLNLRQILNLVNLLDKSVFFFY